MRQGMVSFFLLTQTDPFFLETTAGQHCANSGQTTQGISIWVTISLGRSLDKGSTKAKKILNQMFPIVRGIKQHL